MMGLKSGLMCALLVSAVMVRADEGTPADDTTIYSLIDRRVDVLASDGNALFRSTRVGAEHTKWTAVATPKEMTLGGKFVLPPIGGGENEKQISKTVLFYTSRANELVPEEGKKFGLWVSEDDGNHWRLVNEQWDFNLIARAGDGTLVALAEPPGEGERKPVKILRSADGGATWADMTGNAPELVKPDALSSLSQLVAGYPDRPETVGVRDFSSSGLSTRGIYVLMQGDTDGVWKRYPGAVWEAFRMTPEMYFAPTCTGFNMKVDLDRPMLATFGEFFKYRFGNKGTVEAMSLTPERDAYEFAMGQPMPMRVTMELRPKEGELTILDFASGAELWGARVMTDTGKRVTIVPAAVKRVGDPPKSAEVRKAWAEYSARADIRRTAIARGKGYTRELDLAKVVPFPGPGVYRVQITYGCPRWWDEKETTWAGEVREGVVTVRVK